VTLPLQLRKDILTVANTIIQTGEGPMTYQQAIVLSINRQALKGAKVGYAKLAMDLIADALNNNLARMSDHFINGVGMLDGLDMIVVNSEPELKKLYRSMLKTAVKRGRTI
jgi:hypothetical protein